MAFIQNVDVVDIFFHNIWLFIKRGLTMDDSSVREYERKALLLKQNRNINQVKSIDDLIRLLLNEKEIENFIYEILACELSVEEAEKMEIDLIKERNTLAPNGYNLKANGEANRGYNKSKVPQDIINNLIQFLVKRQETI